MKRAIKMIVPILLSIVILLSIGWYLFEYDPDFTRDMLLNQARYLESQGKLSSAVWFYDLAYHQSENNDQVAIELAEQFKSIGNYTKAESTLSKAIQDGGSLDLYIALCKTFVEQDKLLDAVQMLEMVNNKAIKAELDALRPQAPTASLDSGTYHKFLTVSLANTSGRLYFSTDSQYPSLLEDSYYGPIALSRGDNTIFALCVNDLGLVSTPAVFTYHISDVVELVTFADSAMEEAVRQQAGIQGDRVIYSKDLWAVKEFTVPSNASSCQDLKWLPNLEKLTIQGNVIDDLSPIQNMMRLQKIYIQDSVISSKDVERIGQLKNLTELQLSGCNLSTIAGLAYAATLEYLDLSNNSIRDISILKSMTRLHTLNLSKNALVSLEDLGSISSLRSLDVSYNSLVTTAPLASLTELTYLSISGNSLKLLEGIEALTKLQRFFAAENDLVDIQVLEGCKELVELDVSNNTLLSVSVVSNFAKLERLFFAHNEVQKLPVFATGCPLATIDGSYNELENLDALKDMEKLQYVFMDYNNEIRSVAPLKNCMALIIVNVYKTKVTTVDFLRERGVTVNYSPL